MIIKKDYAKEEWRAESLSEQNIILSIEYNACFTLLTSRWRRRRCHEEGLETSARGHLANCKPTAAAARASVARRQPANRKLTAVSFTIKVD